MKKRTRKNPGRKATKPAPKKGGSTKAGAAKDAAPKAPRTPMATRERDPRLPAVGATIERPYMGKTLRCTVSENGFKFDGEEFRSLSAAAQHATGAESINGFLFWGLIPREAAKPKTPGAGKARGSRKERASTQKVAAPKGAATGAGSEAPKGE